MPSEDAHLIFEQRRQSDPQGVIDDLIKQTSRQGGEIHKRGLEIKRLAEENSELQKSLDAALARIAALEFAGEGPSNSATDKPADG